MVSEGKRLQLNSKVKKFWQRNKNTCGTHPDLYKWVCWHVKLLLPHDTDRPHPNLIRKYPGLRAWHTTNKAYWMTRYANGVPLNAVWENTALPQWMKCEPPGDRQFIRWTLLYFTFTFFLTRSTRQANKIAINLHANKNLVWYKNR